VIFPKRIVLLWLAPLTMIVEVFMTLEPKTPCPKLTSTVRRRPRSNSLTGRASTWLRTVLGIMNPTGAPFLAEDVGGEDGKLVWAVGIVEAAQDVAQELVVEFERQGKFIGGFVAVLFPFEVEEAGVVADVGGLEQLAEARVDAVAVDEGAEAAVVLDAAVLADAEREVARELAAPALEWVAGWGAPPGRGLWPCTESETP